MFQSSKMSPPFSVLPKFNDLMSGQLFYKELMNSECLTDDNRKDIDETLDLNELEEEKCPDFGGSTVLVERHISVFLKRHGSFGNKDGAIGTHVAKKELVYVFSDHILLGKRLQRSLYTGSLEDLDESTNHPPMALTGLALKLFTKAVPNYGLDQLDMDYVSSVSGATRVSPCAMILAMIYLERLQIKNSDYLESVSPSGLFVVTMLAASKFLFENEDDIVTNQIWSEALNMDVKELNILEQKFLAAIDWQLYVSSSEFFQQLSVIEKMIAIRQSSARAWLSYSDVCSILQDALIRKSILISIERVIKVFAVSALSYAVTVFSIYTAGCAISCRYSYNLTSFGERAQLKPSVLIPSPELSHVELSTFVPDKSFQLESISNDLNNKENVGFKDMLVTESNDIASLNIKKSLESFFGNLLFSSHTVHSENISYNHQGFSLNSDKIYNLEWSPFDFKNSCIPVSVR